MKLIDLSERFLNDDDEYQTFRKTASRYQSSNRYGSCHALESQQQCKNRVICKLRSTFSGHGAFSSHELCKKQDWIPHLPEDWFLTAALGKRVNVFVDLSKLEEAGYGDGDVNNINYNEFEDYDNNSENENNSEFNKIFIEESQDLGNEDGIIIEGLPRTLVRMILGLVLGGDDAICR